MVMVRDGMLCSRAPQIVYSSAVLTPVSRIAPLRTVPRNRRRAVPEQEFPPPRRPARSYRPDRDDEGPSPWADLPSVRPARPGRPAAGGYPAGPGRHSGPGGRPAGGPGGPAGPGGLAGPGDPAGPGGRGNPVGLGRHGRPDGPDARPDGPDPRPDGPGRHQDGRGGPGGYGSYDSPNGSPDYPEASGVSAGPGGPGGQRSASASPSAPSAPSTADRSAGPGAPRRAAAPRDDEQVPSWAQWQESGDSGEEDLPPMRAREPRDRGASRALRAAARRRRRWLIMGGGAAVLAGAIVAVVLLTGGHQAPAGNDAGTLVTTFQHGELRQVPNACHVVPATTVQQYLPGKAKVVAPLSVSGPAGSACDWTIDQPPQYRLMELTMQAYAPNGLASGDGSATFAATDAYQLALQELRTPPKNSPAAARATVRELTGFGDAAFTAQ